MPKPDAKEIKHRVRAALSGYVVGVEQWPMMLLDGSDGMTDEEKIDYLIETNAVALAYANLMVQSYARLVDAEPAEVLVILYDSVDSISE